MSTVNPLILTWLKAQEEDGACGECGKIRALFHAMEQTNPAIRPICMECVGRVEAETVERRRRKGIRCYRCNREDGLRVTGLISEPGRFYFACPACFQSQERAINTLLNLKEEDTKGLSETEFFAMLAAEGVTEADWQAFIADAAQEAIQTVVMRQINQFVAERRGRQQ